MDKRDTNEKSRRFNLTGRLKSFGNAFSGLGILLRKEHNFRIHIVILFLVIIAGVLLKISPAEWIMIALASGIVIAAESLNTALEYLSDEVSPGESEKIKKVKDVAAAGVLAGSFFAAAAGLIIFIPRIIGLFR